jgi:ABC-type transporter Mla MlaB component
LGDQERSGRGPVRLAIDGPIVPGDVPRLWERVRGVVEAGEAEVVVCDLEGLAAPDVATLDALARLQLAARRAGGRIRLQHACASLRELLALTGLGEVVPLGAGSVVQPLRQPEQREQPLDVEEEGDPGDLVP